MNWAILITIIIELDCVHNHKLLSIIRRRPIHGLTITIIIELENWSVFSSYYELLLNWGIIRPRPIHGLTIIIIIELDCKAWTIEIELECDHRHVTVSRGLTTM